MKKTAHLLLLVVVTLAAIELVCADDENERNRNYDYIVVGGGTAGCVVASRLSEDHSKSVLLLQEGQPLSAEDEMYGRTFRYLLDNYSNDRLTSHLFSQPDPAVLFRRIESIRPKALGGASFMFAALAERPLLSEILDWNIEGFTEARLLGYYKKLETNTRSSQRHGHSGPMTVQDDDPAVQHQLVPVIFNATRALGIPEPADHNDGFHKIGISKTQRYINRGKKVPSSDAYLTPQVLARPNLKVTRGAKVTKVIFQNAKAVAVEYLNEQNVKIRVNAAREIVLCTGPLVTPQLLMLSGVGAKAELESFGINVVKDLPGVGKNYIQRPFIPIVNSGVNVDPLMEFGKVFSPESFAALEVNGTGPLTASWGPLHIFYSVDAVSPKPDYWIQFTGVLPFFKAPPAAHFFVCLLGDPASRGTISLYSKNPLADPVLRPGQFTDQFGHDISTLVACVKSVRAITNSPAFLPHKGIELGPSDAVQSDGDLAGYVMSSSINSYHEAGTCKLGNPNDDMAVVDPSFRVYGVERLRVVDSSVIPRLFAANPSTTVLMLAEMAADIIIKQQSY